MTDREAFELVVKWGGEKSVLMIKEMIQVAGVETAANNIMKVYWQEGVILTEDYKDWIRQSVNYIASEMNKPLN